MKIGSNCILINCELSRTMRKLCIVLEVKAGAYPYIVAPKDNLSFRIQARENQVRKPKRGEVESGSRLFD